MHRILGYENLIQISVLYPILTCLLFKIFNWKIKMWVQIAMVLKKTIWSGERWIICPSELSYMTIFSMVFKLFMFYLYLTTTCWFDYSPSNNCSIPVTWVDRKTINHFKITKWKYILCACRWYFLIFLKNYSLCLYLLRT